MFWLVSLKMRLLTERLLGPATGALRPSAYRAGPTREYTLPAWPQVGLATLLPDPSRLSIGKVTAAPAGGAPTTRAATRRLAAAPAKAAVWAWLRCGW